MKKGLGEKFAGGGGSFAGGGNWWNGGGGNFSGGGGSFAGGGGLWNGGFATAFPFVGWHGSRLWKFRGVPQPKSKNGGVQYQAAVTTTWPTFSTAVDSTACPAGQVRLGGFATNFDADGWPGFLAWSETALPTWAREHEAVFVDLSAAAARVPMLAQSAPPYCVAIGYSKALCIPTPGNGGLRVQATVGDGYMMGIGGYVLGSTLDTATWCASRRILENTPFGRPDGHGVYGMAPNDMESYANRLMQEHNTISLPAAASAIDDWNTSNFSASLSMKGSDFTPRAVAASTNSSALLGNINRSLVAPLNMVPIDPVTSGSGACASDANCTGGKVCYHPSAPTRSRLSAART